MSIYTSYASHAFRLYIEAPEGGDNLGYHSLPEALAAFKAMRKFSPDAYLELSRDGVTIKRFIPKRYR